MQRHRPLRRPPRPQVDRLIDPARRLPTSRLRIAHMAASVAAAGTNGTTPASPRHPLTPANPATRRGTSPTRANPSGSLRA